MTGQDKGCMIPCIRYIRDVISCLTCINQLMLLQVGFKNDALQALTENINIVIAEVQWAAAMAIIIRS